jgi:hypothetical protein
MGTELYGRVCKLVVAPSGGGEGLSVEDLRITFRVEKTSSSEPNKATIQVYNLNQWSRQRVEEKNQALVLTAGYEDVNARIFVGVVKRVEHRRAPPDIVTEMECADGGVDLETAEFRRSYKAGTSRLRVVKDIITAMPNTDTGPLTASELSGSIPGRLALSGGCRHVLNRLAKSWGFEWSIQDEAIQVLTEATGTVNPQALAVVLSPETGLIGSPTKTDRGAKFKSLLMPTINPGSFVSLDSAFVKGYYKAESTSDEGDTHGSAWHTEVEGKTLPDGTS